MFSRLNDMKFGVKLLIGIGGILILLVLNSAASFFGLWQAGGALTRYQQLTNQAAQVTAARADLLEVAAEVQQYLIDGSTESADKAKADIAAVRQDLQIAENGATTDEGRARLAGIKDRLANYSAIFETVVASRERRDVASAEINKLGSDLEKKLTGIMAEANEAYDAELAYKAGQVLRSLLIQRAELNRYLLDQQAETFALVEAEKEPLDTSFEDLLGNLQFGQDDELTEALKTSVAAYQQGLLSVRDLVVSLNGILAEELEPAAAAILADAAGAYESIRDEQTMIGTEARDGTEKTEILSVVATLICVVIGLAAAFLIAKRNRQPLKEGRRDL